MARLSAPKSRLNKLKRQKTQRTGKRRSDGPVNTSRWQKLRLEVCRREAIDISESPELMPDHILFPGEPFLWPVCQATGELLTGEYPAPDSPVVDHRRPHRGDLKLFWDPNNLQVVSKKYHDRVKQRMEAGGSF